MRLTLEEYSKHFKMSKEMIHSKLRAKKLNYIIENSVTFIIVPRSSLEKEKCQEIHEEKKKTKVVTKQEIVVQKQKTTVAMILGLYKKENQQLKEKIAHLESKIDKLIDDKEQMLRDEIKKIEQVYSDKDSQLKNILELINTQLKSQKEETILEIEPISVEENQIIELKSYLKTLDIESYQKKVIKKRFLAVYGKDVRVIKQNGKLFLDFSRYDYSDLLEY